MICFGSQKLRPRLLVFKKHLTALDKPIFLYAAKFIKNWKYPYSYIYYKALTVPFVSIWQWCHIHSWTWIIDWAFSCILDRGIHAHSNHGHLLMQGWRDSRLCNTLHQLLKIWFAEWSVLLTLKIQQIIMRSHQPFWCWHQSSKSSFLICLLMISNMF